MNKPNDILPVQSNASSATESHAVTAEGETPYASQWELMNDQFALIDYRLYLYYKHHQWLGPASEMRNMLGLVVSREEFEHNLVKAAQTGLYTHLSAEDCNQLMASESAVRKRLQNTRHELPLLRLFERFALDDFGGQVVTLAYAAYIEGKYERLFAYLQDDITKKAPTVSLAVQLYLPEGGSVEEYSARFRAKSLFTSLFEEESLEQGTLVLCREVKEYLDLGTVTPGAGMLLFDGEKQEPEAPLIVGQELSHALDAALMRKAQAVSIAGMPGSGRRFQITHLMRRRGESCLFADMDVLGHGEQGVEKAALVSRLMGAYVCCHGLDAADAEGNPQSLPSAFFEAASKVRLYIEPLFLVSQRPLGRPVRTVQMDFIVEPASAADRLELFSYYLSGTKLERDASLPEIAGKFHFTPLQISRACKQAKSQMQFNGESQLSSHVVHSSCYKQAVHKLDRLAVKVEPRFDWEDVVLPAAQKRLMQHACDHIRYAHRVYHDWGFENKISYGKGLSILFAGAPGTGKTMCAQVMARQLNMEVYKINISQIVSKYIGETEKNLQAVFSEAKHSNSILFFDECDAIFGKRSDVKDAHDRNANVEVAYLLQQIEEYDGVCVLATNLIQNIDAAFMRRITYVVHFPFPDTNMRKEIYLRTLPPQAPVDTDTDWNFIAQKFELSGGHIKNIVLGAAFMAASQKGPIGMRQLLNAAVNEMRKNEIVVVREELREYADLLDID